MLLAELCYRDLLYECQFQWAPTLGGECYLPLSELDLNALYLFQWAPTLGGECYPDDGEVVVRNGDSQPIVSMGTHPWG